LEVTVEKAQQIAANSETYYTRMRPDGRLNIPKLVVELCEIKAGDIVEIRLSPTNAINE